MTGGISIRGIRKAFGAEPGAIVALDGIDLDIEPGEFVAVVGPSGCGKSTLLRIIAGLTPATAGSVSVFGKNVSGPVTECGVVFQQPILLDWRTIVENVLFNIDMRGLDPNTYRPRALQLLAAVGLADFADKRPHELSGGMKQRAAVARTLANQPEVMLMDEPFAAVDAQTRLTLQEELVRLWTGNRVTVLFVTHSVDEAVFLADRVAVLTPGPGRVKAIVEVPIERARRDWASMNSDPTFLAIRDRVLALVRTAGA